MLRRLILLVVSGALMAALTATAAFAQRDDPPETEQNEIYGTGASETFYGTYGVDLIAGEGGHDLLVGEAGADTLLGGTGDDYIVAGYGWWQIAPNAPASPDFIQGGAGHDLIDSADLAGAPDDVRCGPGSDLVYAGVEDNVAADCEFVYRYDGFY
jgi:Ca2+-binding RTX toxin-like protein